MTDTLKTVLVDALNLAGRFPGSTEVDDVVELGVNDTIHTNYSPLQMNATVLATAVRDHFLDREKVRAALIAAISEEFSLTNIEGVYPGLPNDTHEFATSTGSDCTGFNINVMVDRLIAGLAGGSSE